MGFIIVSKIRLNIFKILFMLIFGICVMGSNPVMSNVYAADTEVTTEAVADVNTQEPDDNTKLMIVVILGGGLIIIIATVLSVVLSTATTVASVVTEQDAADM